MVAERQTRNGQDEECDGRAHRVGFFLSSCRWRDVIATHLDLKSVPVYGFQVDVFVLASNRKEAQQLFEKNLKSKLSSETEGIVGLVIHDGVE